MTNPSKKRGTAWETQVVRYLQQWWPNTERRALNGGLDKGDVLGLPGLVVECKSVNRIQLAEWSRKPRLRPPTLAPNSEWFGPSEAAKVPPQTAT
jgi:hypothetical protein